MTLAPAERLLRRVEALRRERPDRAWSALRRDFVRAVRAASPAERGEIWRLRGHVLRSLRRAREAVAAYRAAERHFARARNERERGRCAIGLVDALMYLGRYRDALRAAADGRRRLEKVGDDVSLGRLLGNVANVWHRLDLPERAIAEYAEAQSLLRRAGDAFTAGMLEANVGNCLALLGRCAEARTHYERASAEAERAKRPLDALRASYNLAYLEFLEQRPERALEALERTGEDAEARGYPSLAALARLDRAEIFVRLGAHEETLDEAAEAIRRCESLGLRYELAKAEVFAALAEHRVGRPAAAARRLERAIEAFHAEGNAVWTGEALVGLATVWDAARQPLAAAALLRAAALHFRSASAREREAAALALLARSRLAAGDVRGAAETVRRLDRRLGTRPSPRALHLALGARGARPARGDVRARRALVLAARESERLAARILDEHWRASFWGEWGWPHRALAALELGEGRVEAAIEALEAGRGRSLLASRARLAPGRALERRVREWAASRAVRDRSRGTRAETAEAPAALPANLERALARRLPERVTASAIRRALPGETVLLDYLVADGGLAAIRADARGFAAMRGLVSEARLQRAVHDLLFSLRSAAHLERDARAADRATRDDLERLAALVLWPALAGRAPEALCIAPTAALARVPWAALPLPDGRPLAAASTLAIVPGLRLGLAPKRATRPTAAPLIVAGADADLPAVREEVQALQRLFPAARRLEGADATAGRFLELGPAAEWIHFAGHGAYEAAAPQLSGLRLADRWLPAAELGSVVWSARWITLSACQTARALVRPGEEWFGLARTLLLSGAGAVVAAQWDVEDAAAGRLMAGLYGQLRAGRSPAQGLARVQAEASGAGEHPLDWAGFVALGGPGVLGAYSPAEPGPEP